jgi:hypothetical protein
MVIPPDSEIKQLQEKIKADLGWDGNVIVDVRPFLTFDLRYELQHTEKQLQIWVYSARYPDSLDRYYDEFIAEVKEKIENYKKGEKPNRSEHRVKELDDGWMTWDRHKDVKCKICFECSNYSDVNNHCGDMQCFHIFCHKPAGVVNISSLHGIGDKWKSDGKITAVEFSRKSVADELGFDPFDQASEQTK